MNPIFRTKATLTEEDFKELYKTNLLKTQGPLLAVLIVVIAGVAAAIAIMVKNSMDKGPLFAVILALIIVAAFSAIIFKNLFSSIKTIAKNQIAAHEEAHPGIPYTVINEVGENSILTGLDIEETEKTEVPLSDLKKIIVTKNAAICATKAGQSLLFKKDSFTEGTFEDFVSFITEEIRKSNNN